MYSIRLGLTNIILILSINKNLKDILLVVKKLKRDILLLIKKFEIEISYKN